MIHDEKIMRRALELARRGEGAVSPNPMVGAVLARGGKIIVEGWHKYFGGRHAEIEVIRKARQKGVLVSGATLYVNLEPCAHEDKKTPPCVPEIIKTKISRVVVACRDPNPKVNGKGILSLRAAEIRVDVGCLGKQSALLNEKYNKWISTGLPFIGLKAAMSLDGKIATRTGDSKWITSEASRSLVRRIRDQYDAILVGINTVLKDNPALAGLKREPKRIVLDSFLCTPVRSKILRDKNVLIVTTGRAQRSKIKAMQDHGVPLQVFAGKIQLASLLRSLGKQNISSVLVEGGSEIFGSFMDARLADKLHWFLAPKIIGGRAAKTAVGGEGVSVLRKALCISDYSISKAGPDIFIEACL